MTSDISKVHKTGYEYLYFIACFHAVCLECILEIAFYSFFIVVLKPLVLLIGHILAFDVKIAMDTHEGGNNKIFCACIRAYGVVT